MNYPAYKVQRFNDSCSYFLIASPTNCVEFLEERNASNNFGFCIRTLKSRPVVKARVENSTSLPKEIWFAEVKASMLAHLESAMEMVALCEAVMFTKTKPVLADYAHVASESAAGFDQAKRGLARNILVESGAALDHSHANQLLLSNRRDATS